tara:strand:+ start:319 stop:429 length:111 start_codon:yes stop_codon:yes gene_type:complete
MAKHHCDKCGFGIPRGSIQKANPCAHCRRMNKRGLK